MKNSPTIASIRALTWVGAHHLDSPNFRLIGEFASNPAHSVQERAEALRIQAHVGMGLRGEDACDHLPDEELVALFMGCMQ